MRVRLIAAAIAFIGALAIWQVIPDKIAGVAVAVLSAISAYWQPKPPST